MKMKKIISLVIIFSFAVSLLVSCSSGIKNGDVDEYIVKTLELVSTKLKNDEYFALYGSNEENDALRSLVKDTDFTHPVAVYEMTINNSSVFGFMSERADYFKLTKELRDSLNIASSLVSAVNARKSTGHVAFSAAITSNVTFACSTQKEEKNYIYVYDNISLLVNVSESKNDVVRITASPFFADGTDKEAIEEVFSFAGTDVKIK